MRRLSRTLVPALAATALLLAGCGGDDDNSNGSADDGHNDADVSFATEMIPHHEQALRMVAMTEGRDLSPDFEHLTEHIQDAQQPEIETMTGWLEDWGEDVPSGHMHQDGMAGSDGMAGMMDEDDLDDLEASERSAFERMWLVMMIDHHEGAVEMAEDELDDGSYQPALDLADSIAESQTDEIEQMREMLGAP